MWSLWLPILAAPGRGEQQWSVLQCWAKPIELVWLCPTGDQAGVPYTQASQTWWAQGSQCSDTHAILPLSFDQTQEQHSDKGDPYFRVVACLWVHCLFPQCSSSLKKLTNGRITEACLFFLMLEWLCSMDYESRVANAYIMDKWNQFTGPQEN